MAHTPRLTLWCAGTACGIALVAWLGWLLDVRFLAGQWGTYLPMAPSTALALLLLGGGLIAESRWPSRLLGRRVALAGASLAALLGLLVLVEFVTGYDSSVQWALARTSEMLGGVRVGRMSPLAAATLLLESSALLLMLHVTRRRVAGSLAALLALLATVVNVVVLLGYFYGAPLLYGGPIVPVAIPTALAFTLLGVGQVNLMLPQVAALRRWQRGTLRGVLLRAFLPAMFCVIILDGWTDAVVVVSFRSTNPAVWNALLALATCGLLVAIIGWIARRTGDEIERAHAAASESAEQYRLAVNATNDGMWHNNLNDGIISFNESYVAAFGKPAEQEDPRLWWTDHVHPDDRERTLSSFNAAVNGSGDTWKCEYRFRRVDGTWANTYDRAHIRRDGTGKATYIIGALSDITETKRTEAALRESEVRYRRLFDANPHPMWVYDVKTLAFLQVNDAALAKYGYRRDEFLAMTIADIRPAEDVAKLVADVSHIHADGMDEGSVWKHRRKDGSIIDVEIAAHTIDDHGRLARLVLVQDITARKRAEDEKTKLEAQLRQAQKMESVGRLAGGVAHDFNNMLGVILGCAELAEEQVNPADPLYAELEEIRKAAARSAVLTRQLLAFARKQTILPIVLNLNEIVTGMLTMLHRLIREEIDLQWQPRADLWTVSMDPSQIDQILANLCVNARDAITGVGTLSIATGNSTLDEGYCSAHVGCAPGQYVRLTVSDNGCGMDKHTLAQIFEPFFTTKGVGEGTGLGLATVYGAVKQNHGYIDVVSEQGLGTTFTIYLPRHAGAPTQVQAEGVAGPMPRGDETILLVEDEPSILTLSKRMLERQGYTVLSASTPGDALRLAQAHTGEIELLITDVIMPEMNGRTLAKNLRSVNPHLKRLFMSGYTADVIAHHGVLDEGLHFIQKPFSIEDLATKVRDTLDAED